MAETMQPRQLSDAERADLKKRLTTNSTALKSRSLGYKVRGQPLTGGAVVSQVPASLENADVSVCGVKGFMVDETIEFAKDDGSTEQVDCAHVASLDIADSPVHVHGVTHEIYEILTGKGQMVLDDSVTDVAAGSIVVLPPGIVHGLASKDPEVPVRVLLHFSPSLAPKSKPEFRDEAILYERTSERIAQLMQQVVSGIRSSF
ncbi:cupin domain-containing protein [Candidatus Peregrinibacteria bacterium]|nr:cupin domain-containing protein [Candidatus Peregrinibacteria bacterium]